MPLSALQKRNPTSVVWLFVGVTLVFVPLVPINGLIWDDWVQFWRYWVGGPAKLKELLWESAHYGFYPPHAAMYLLGGEYYGILGRVVGIIGHAAGSWLLYLVLRKSYLTRPTSAWSATIFLVSPFYFARGISAYYIYDCLLALFLASIWLLHFRKRSLDFLAVICYVVSLSFEPLVVLEPLRLIYLYRKGRGISWIVRRAWMFWLAGALIAALRLFWLKPTGAYAGYNAIQFEIYPIVARIYRHGMYYFETVEPIFDHAWGLAGAVGFALVAAAAVTCGWLASRRRIRVPNLKPDRRTILLMGFGVMLAMLGALPYALTDHQVPTILRFGRQTLVSLVGVSIFAGAAVAIIPFRALRASVFAVLMGVLVLSSLFVTKWFMYDTILQRDLVMQIGPAFSTGPELPPIIGIHMTPGSTKLTVLGRYFSRDLVVPLNMMRDPSLPPVFAQDADRYSRDRTWSRESTAEQLRLSCTIDTAHKLPCSREVRFVEYVLDPEFRTPSDASFWSLLRLTVSRSTVAPIMGRVTGIDDLLTRPRAADTGNRRRGAELVPRVMGFIPQ